MIRPRESFRNQTELLKVLAHPVRLAILEVLRDGEQCVCHLEAVLALRQAYISQHLMVLREAGLVADRRDGWNMYYRAARPKIYAVLDTLGKVTGRRAVRLDATGARKTCPCPRCNPQREPAAC